MNSFWMLAAAAGVGGWRIYTTYKSIERNTQRAQFDSYPYIRESFIGIPMKDGAILLQIKREGVMETIAVFAPNMEIASRHPLTDNYDFFIREPNTENLRLPLYLKSNRRQIGEPYSLRKQHTGGLMLPNGYNKSEDKFYCDIENFAAVKLHKEKIHVINQE